MKNKLKTFFADNIGWKIISLILGLIVWAVLSNAQDPIISRTVSVPVNYLNETKLLLNERLCVLSSPETVSINVSVRQSKASRLKSDLFTCTADLIDHYGGDLSNQRVHITVTQQNGSDVVLDWNYNKNDANIYVAMDEYIEKEFAVQLLTTDELTEGLILDNSIEFNPATVTVAGPKSKFGNVTAVKALVNLSELSEGGGGSFAKEVDLKLYDANDNVVSNTDGRLKVSRQTADMSCTVSRLQTAKVVIDGISGVPAEGYRYVSNQSDPETLSLKGLKVTVADLSEIHIPAEAIDISGISSDRTYEVDIMQYLPEGVSLAGGDGTVTVTVYVEHIEGADIPIPRDQIRIDGAQSDLTYQIVSDTTLQVQGFLEDLEVLNLSSLTPAIDVSALKPGVHVAQVTILQPAGYYFINADNLSVQVAVSQKPTEPEEETTLEPEASQSDHSDTDASSGDTDSSSAADADMTSPSDKGNDDAKPSESDASSESETEVPTEAQSESESSEGADPASQGDPASSAP